MAERIKRKAFTSYEEAFDGFTEERKNLNYLAENDIEGFITRFDEVKQKALQGDCIAMDILAYYYKTGVRGALKENYMRYISWEFLAAARGNTLAIEKLQFVIGSACDQITQHDEYDVIEYKNDIDMYNELYVLGKNFCKIVVRDFLKAFPVDLVALPDDAAPYKKEDSIILQKYIDEAIAKTIDFMKS